MTTSTQDAPGRDPLGAMFADTEAMHFGHRRHARIDEPQVRSAMRLIEAAGISDEVRRWLLLEHDPRKGGRPPWITTDQVLVLLLVLAMEHAPLLVTTMETAVQRLTPKAWELLDLPRTQNQVKEASGSYYRLWRSLDTLVGLIDPCPFPKGRRLTNAEFKDFVASLDPDWVQERKRRRLWLTNRLLHATYLAIPTEVRARWKGQTAVDGTRILACEKGSPASAKLMDPKYDDARLSAFADGGWHVREKPSDPERTAWPAEGKRAKFHWAYEAHTVQMLPDQDGAPVPRIVVGVSYDKPSFDPGPNAALAYTDMAARGLPAGIVLSDRAYFPGAKVEHFHTPMRALGHQLIGDYKRADIGVALTREAGANLIEGRWYCPSMPDRLVTANRDFADGLIDDATRQKRLTLRTAYEVRPKQAPGTGGQLVMMCPAAGAGATVVCSFKLKVTGRRGAIESKGRPLIPVAPTEPDRICTNKSSTTFPAGTGAKYVQDGPAYGTTAWQRLYGQRSQIEASNAYFKNQSHEAADDPGRRRKRGLAAQALLVTMLIMSANLRLIQSFLIREAQSPAPAKSVGARKNRNAAADAQHADSARPQAPPVAA